MTLDSIYGSNVYYSPASFGLTTVGTIDLLDESYEFDIITVWSDGAGRLFWAFDSGCSCPVPFEWATSIDDLSTGTFADFHAFVEEQIARVSHRNLDDYIRGQFIDLGIRARALSSPTGVSDMIDDGTLTPEAASELIIRSAIDRD